MLLNSAQVTEIIAETKRADLERAVERGRMLAEIGAHDTSVHPRQAIAGLLVRLAVMIDAGAGTRTAAAAH